MGWFWPSESEAGFEAGKDAIERNGPDSEPMNSFANQINPFTSKEYKDAYERGQEKAVEDSKRK